MQDQPTRVAVAAIVRVLETEAAHEVEAAVIAASEAQARGMHGLVQPLHAGRTAGIAAEQFGALGSGAPGAPECERRRGQDHQDE